MWRILPPHVTRALEAVEASISRLTVSLTYYAWLDEYRPLAAVNAAMRLRVYPDILLTQAVGRARGEGYSWEDVASPLGTTRQSAHERFSSR
ncbi:hypothetical protein [Streptomyces sp. NPDC046862]|uniref:hypothetical protein n=1 Tax=Streptomyces sp. NPDC046862 TaxID=3154603 RepID=UPI0034521F14